jgi:DNA-binding NtrC family response regulator
MRANGLTMDAQQILIIDDEEEFRKLMAQVLQREGYQVQEAATGEQGLESVRQRAPDLVLLDLNLPDLNGLVVLARILKLQPSTRVVMITGMGEVSIAVEAMKLGASDFIPKPPDIPKLKVAIHSLLRQEHEPEMGFHAQSILGRSPEIKEVWAQVSRYARPDVSILLSGESGTGKELFARAIHERSKRGAEPFVALDCATLPETLVESELFGHEKGAFTGAAERKIGKFEMANGGTIFLDEISNLPLHFQAKLLRVVQERYINRLGGNKPVAVDVRIVSATNLDLSQAIRKGTFREDLYYRLAEVVIALPPLRERRNEIELLVRHFVDEFNRRFGRTVRGISEEAWLLLRGYRWPGNVRELRNVIKFSLLAADDLIGVDHLPEYLKRAASVPGQGPPAGIHLREQVRSQVEEGLASGTLHLKELVARYSEEAEKAVLEELLSRRRFTQAELCALLNLDPKTLRAKLLKYGLKTRVG